MQSFIFYFGDLLYSAVGNCSLSHVRRSKISWNQPTAEIPLKKGQEKRPNRQQKRRNFICFICCFCKLCSVTIIRLQWKDIVKFHVIFRDLFVGTEHNFRQFHHIAPNQDSWLIQGIGKKDTGAFYCYSLVNTLSKRSTREKLGLKTT